MGGGASTLLKDSGQEYSKRAKTSKEFADTLLTVLFSKLDYKDLLNLSSLQTCPAYVFTTAKALDSLFTKLKIMPKLGKGGEILYAPISDLAPGLLKTGREGTRQLADEIETRNTMCMNVAYYYVRIFQIYAALALTVMEADPVRVQKGIGPAAATAKGPQKGVFQKGGKIAQRGSYPQIYQGMVDSVLRPIIPYFSVVPGGEYLVMDSVTGKQAPGFFFLKWETPKKNESVVTLAATYRKGSQMVDASVTFARSAGNSSDEIVMSIDNIPIQSFVFTLPNDWLFKYEDRGAAVDGTKPDIFYERIHDYFAEKFPMVGVPAPGMAMRPGGVAAGPAAPAAAFPQAAAVAVPTGKSVFRGFDALKKVFQDRKDGKPSLFFPKAYAIGRAMILMNPIFGGEQRNAKQPYRSSVCLRSFDFEEGGTEFMPRPGRQPEANLYFQSLVALYYDDYKVRGGQVTFEQTESGKTRLREDSAKMAALYGLTQKPGEVFLEGKQEFRRFDKLCGTTRESVLQYKPELRNAMLKEVVIPLLKHQEDHTKKVNELLKKMFDVSINKKTGQTTLFFTDRLVGNGLESINAIGREAATLLLDYYLKSEALFVKGVLLFEKNPDKFVVV